MLARSPIEEGVDQTTANLHRRRNLLLQIMLQIARAIGNHITDFAA